ncbi:hypothetical protein DFH08DRAFT_818283 [Mycena albidolilacea]|uniref:Uncharacterized protein n=1 Tax=Mycena albidolilacea TaxID=1033008 RepID=A0AAD6ZGX6_9AGAR|nr:hypothetical protein DFH08DRAFT_818283 [Mycena albidolilacea]
MSFSAVAAYHHITDLPDLGFDLHPNPSPSPKKPVGAGASPFCKPKSELSFGLTNRRYSAARYLNLHVRLTFGQKPRTRNAAREFNQEHKQDLGLIQWKATPQNDPRNFEGQLVS